MYTVKWKLISTILMLGVVAACGKREDAQTSSPPPSVQPSAAEAAPTPAQTPSPPQEQLKFPLKVKNVGLGISNAPCDPIPETYVDIIQKPVRIQLECSFGSESDRTQVVFSADGKEIVRVLRKQYLTPSDPEPSDIVTSAIKFYGKPENQDDGNWLANYGTAYSITYNERRANTELNDTGIGLLIKGSLCAARTFGFEDCGNLGTTVIKYDLIDIEGYKKQVEAGKALQAAKKESTLSNQKF